MFLKRIGFDEQRSNNDIVSAKVELKIRPDLPLILSVVEGRRGIEGEAANLRYVITEIRIATKGTAG